LRKRVFCALWMAAFADLAAFPLWLISRQSIPLTAVALLTLSGGVVGMLVQPHAVGRHSTVTYAALVGTACAVLAMPIFLLALFVSREPAVLLNPVGLFTVTLAALSVSSMGTMRLWWLLPIGALAGATLQLIWVRTGWADDSR